MKRQTIVKVLFVSVLLVVLSAFALIMPSAAEANPLDVAYCNLSFENEVHILYAIESNDPDVQLLVWNGTQDAYTNDTPHDTAEVVARNYNINGVSHTVFSYDGLAAKQMTDVVYARAYNPTTGEYGALDKYSILQYAYNMLGKTGNNPSTNEGLKAMLTQMLEYGASAQTCFGYKPDRLANADWVQIQVKGGTLEDGFSCGLYLEGDTVALTAPETDADGVPFSYWEDEKGIAISNDCICNLTVGNTNETYEAIYGTVFSEGLAFTSNGDGTCYVSGIGTCTDLDIIIPDLSPEGDRVTGIGDYAFQNRSSLTNITIPNSVTSIGNYAFYHCYSLTSITIPDSVTSIGDSAFYYCRSLTSITIPNSVTSIGDSAFYYCSSLTSITIPNSVTSIADLAFFHCSSLTSITIPNSVTSIGNSAFSYCSSLTSITVAKKNTIYHSSGNCLIETASKALIVGCKNSVIPTDGSVTSIGDSAFYGCSSLTSITIPNSVTSIGDSAFHGCSSLTSITIPNSVTSIGDNAFYYCRSLTSITIPNSVTSIGDSAFSSCSSLTSITIPNSVTSIGNSAFGYCSSLTSITIPDSVTSIGDSAFYYCSSLTSITIPDSVTSIGDSAFYSCSSLTSITVAKKNTIYHSSGNCLIETASKALIVGCKNSVIPTDGSVTSIGDSAFYNCRSLTSVTIPDSVTSIGDSAFSSCSSLTSITISNSLTSIGDSAFYYCSSLTSVTIPNSVTSIGNSAFGYCRSLTSITIPNSVTSIADLAFRGCTSLTHITFQGTKAQWETMKKSSNWNNYSELSSVVCSDGTITY